MKKVLIISLGLMFCTGLLCNAAGKLSAEDRQARKELLEKYDTNKDKKLSAEEKAKMTAEDKEKWDKLTGGGKKEKAK